MTDSNSFTNKKTRKKTQKISNEIFLSYAILEITSLSWIQDNYGHRS